MCANRTITAGLAETTETRAVIGLDHESGGFRPAVEYARQNGISALRFVSGDVFALPFRDSAFDAALAHSILEAVRNLLEAIGEIRRVLKPGGLIGAASVDYGGLLISGDASGLLADFYELRKQLWEASEVGFPNRGRSLRSMLHEAGFRRISASARYLSYGTPSEVRSFGLERARERARGDFRVAVLAHGLAEGATLEAMEKRGESGVPPRELF